MVSLEVIRADLKRIRYYYSRQEALDEAFKVVGENEILKTARRYHDAVIGATPKLYDLYVMLYVKNHTQESLAVELNYTPTYIQMLHVKLLKYIQQHLKEEE